MINRGEKAKELRWQRRGEERHEREDRGDERHIKEKKMSQKEKKEKRKWNDRMAKRREGKSERREGEKERSDYTKQACGLTVICVVLCCPYMVMECVNAATVVTCIDQRSDHCRQQHKKKHSHTRQAYSIWDWTACTKTQTDKPVVKSRTDWQTKISKWAHTVKSRTETHRGIKHRAHKCTRHQHTEAKYELAARLNVKHFLIFYSELSFSIKLLRKHKWKPYSLTFTPTQTQPWPHLLQGKYNYVSNR